MDDFILSQNSARVQAILNEINPVVENDGDLAGLGIAYGYCSTAGSTAIKEVSISNFILHENSVVAIYFQNAFTASNPKLKIGSNDAKNIYYMNAGALPPGKVRANTVVTMVYSMSTFWVIGIESRSAASTEGGVDLALPSGLLWCEHNVGASRPEDPGLYFSWGNVTGHAEGSGYDFSQANYDASAGAYISSDIAVGDEFDMAHHNMGGQWRLPRRAEFVELSTYCTHEWIDQDGMFGMRFTSSNNGNSIFFPAAGYYNGTTLSNRGTNGGYWSSGFSSASSAYSLSFYSASVSPQNYYDRSFGFTVRAVQ